ncbi:restriction endonuclease subunit S [Acinetobacter sp. YH12039]|uniref:restriction endonuclease subunit S n=1 Tax=Acinetobacter sp. YH12039 TaxID=2601047 RepID=UPI0015D41DAE|nr:restriction endonuclease subunit S [Acinetobacter sp. YH12039]
MSYPMIEIGDLMLKRNGSVDPSKFPDETFELHSIPAFDKGTPDIVKGSEIGSSKQLVQENDVMISKIVPHIRRASVVCPKGDYRQIASGEWIIFRSDKIYPDYLKHVLISDTFNKQFMATVSGVGGSLLRARPAFVAKIKIALPPLAEQRRIASILDQADELRQKRQQAIEKLDQLLQATFIDMFGDPVSNSKKWTEKTLGEVVVFNTGKLDSNAAEENGIYPFFTCSRTPFAINTYAFDIEALLLAGNNAAGQYWVKHYKGKFNAYQRTYVLTIKDSLCTYGYLRYVLQFLLGFLQRMSKGSSTKYLTLSILKPIKIPIPPLELQRKFIQFYENIDSQNQLLMRNEIEFSKLFFTLQNQAFNGTL